MKSNKPQGTPEVSTYDFNGMSLRVVRIDGEAWFVGQDIVVALCGQASGFENVYDFVKNDEKQKV